MSSNAKRALGGAVVVVVAVVLLVVLKGNDSSSEDRRRQAADDRRRQGRSPGRRDPAADLQQGGTDPLQGEGPVRRRGPPARLRRDEGHPGRRRLGHLQPAGDDRRRLRGRARGSQGTDHRTDGQSVSLLHALPLAHALVARKDLPIPAWLFAWGASIVLIVSFFALSAAWREPRFEEERWRSLGAGLSRALLGIPAQVLCGAVGVFLLGVSVYSGHPRHRSSGSQLRDHLPLRHGLARLPAVQRALRQRLQAVQPLAGDRAGRRRRVPGARRPALGPSPPTPRRSAAGRPRSA